MKKFYSVLMMLMVSIFVPFLTACNDGPTEIQVTKIETQDVTVAMEVGQKYQLRYSVLPSEVPDIEKGVKFVVDDKSKDKISVDDKGVVTALKATGNDFAIITIESLSNPKNCHPAKSRIKVLNKKEALPKPQNFYFDANTNSLTWRLLNYQDFNESYELVLIAENGDEQKIVLDENKYDKYERGVKYQAKVRYLSGENTKYKDSPYSDTISFEKLDIKNINLSADMSVSDKYEVRGWKFSFDSSIDAPILKDGDRLANYKIELKYSDVDIDVGMDLWGDDINYAIYDVDDKGIGKVTISVSQKIPNGRFKICIQALAGNNDNSDLKIFNSEVYETAFTKLARPENINRENNTLIWNSVPAAEHYRIVYKYKTSISDDSGDKVKIELVSKDINSHKIPDELLNVSELQIFVYSVGNDSNLIDSISSDNCAMTRLPQVNDLKIANRESNNDIELIWTGVHNADLYQINIEKNRKVLYTEKIKAVVGTNKMTLSLDQKINNNTEKLWNEGIYDISIVSLSNDSKNFMPSNESEKIRITKLNSLDLRVENGELVWNKIDYKNQELRYKLKIENIDTQKIWNKELVEGESNYSLVGGEFVNYSGKFNVSLMACVNNNPYYIASDLSKIIAEKISTPSKISIKDGEISNVDTKYCYIMNIVKDDNGNQTFLKSKSFDSDGMVEIKKYLHDLDKNYAYRLSLIVTGLKSANIGTNYIYSEETEPVAIRYIDAPTLSVMTGELYLNKPTNSYIFNGDKLKPGYKMSYEVKFDKSLDVLSFDSVGKDGNLLNRQKIVLPHISNNIRVDARCIVTYDGEPLDFYVLNSSYYTNSSLRVLDDVKNVKLKNMDLSWESVRAANGYRVEILDDNNNIVADAVPDRVFAENVKLDETKFNSAGDYKIRVYAIGNNINNLNSHKSNYCAINRLPSPIVNIRNGVLEWDKVLDKNNNQVNEYKLYWTTGGIDGVSGSMPISSNSTPLTSFASGVYSNVYVIASSNNIENTLDSNVPNRKFNFEKLDKYSLDSILVVGSVVRLSKIPNIDYELKLYKKEINGGYTLINESIVNDKNVVHSYTIPESFGGGEYKLSVRLLGGQNKINSTTQEIILFRLETVLNTHIEEATGGDKLKAKVLEEQNLPGYSSTTEPIIDLGRVSYEVFVNKKQKSFNAQALGIDGILMSDLYTTVSSNTISDKAVLEPGKVASIHISSSYDVTNNAERRVNYNGSTCFILDGPVSPLYQFKPLKAPAISINDDGMFSWEKVDCDGVHFEFFEVNNKNALTGEKVEKDFPNSQFVCDLTTLTLDKQKKYVVKSQAIGSVPEKQNSNLVMSNQIISILPTLKFGESGNCWSVKDGQFSWRKVNGAYLYRIYYNSRYEDISESSLDEYKYLLKAPAATYNINFQVIGAQSKENIIIGEDKFSVAYITGAKSDNKQVTKLDTVIFEIKNGELSWQNVLNNNGYQVIVDNQEEALLKDVNIYEFSQKNIITDTFYSVQAFSKGNTVNNGEDMPYLNGNMSKLQKVLLNAPVNLFIEQGQLKWKDSKNNNRYELELKSNDGTDIKSIDSKKYTELSEENYNGKFFNSIAVRIKGDSILKEYADYVKVNSAYSNSLLNVQKLERIAPKDSNDFAEINESGLIKWTYGNKYESAKPKTKVSSYYQGTNSKSKIASNELTYTNSWFEFDLTKSLETISIIHENYTPKVKMDLYLMGTESSVGSTGTMYLNSNISSYETYKFGDIVNLSTDRVTVDNDSFVNLNLSWVIDNSIIKTPKGNINPNQIIIQYKEEKGDWQEKIINSDHLNELNSIPQFFSYGSYQFKFFAMNSNYETTLLKSLPALLGEGSYYIPFHAFMKGEGQRDIPFAITNRKQLLYVNYLPTSYFVLDNDINMGDVISGSGTNLRESFIKNITFKGGLDGNGYKIYNIKYEKNILMESVGLYKALEGSELTTIDAKKPDRFYNKTGIIMNLVLEVSKLDIVCINEYNGILVDRNAGYIYNCELRKSIDSKESDIMIVDENENTGTENQYVTRYFGGFCGVSCPNLSGFGGVVDGCINKIDIDTSNSRTYKIAEDESISVNNFSKIGGISGVNKGGRIVDCVNYGNLSASELGGITSRNMFIKYNKTTNDDGSNISDVVNENSKIEAKQYNGVIVGCSNFGDVTVETHESTNSEWASGGGISACIEIGNIISCYNAGKIKAVRKNEDYSSYMILGGISGFILGGSIYNSYSENEITRSINGDGSTYIPCGDIASYVFDDAADLNAQHPEVKIIQCLHNKAALEYYQTSNGGISSKPTDSQPIKADITSNKNYLNEKSASMSDLIDIKNIKGNIPNWYYQDNNLRVGYGHVHSLNLYEGGWLDVTEEIKNDTNETKKSFLEVSVKVSAKKGYSINKLVYILNGNKPIELKDSDGIYKFTLLLTNENGDIIMNIDEINIYFSVEFVQIEYSVSNQSKELITVNSNGTSFIDKKLHFGDVVSITVNPGVTVNRVYYTFNNKGTNFTVDVDLVNGARFVEVADVDIKIFAE